MNTIYFGTPRRGNEPLAQGNALGVASTHTTH